VLNFFYNFLELKNAANNFQRVESERSSASGQVLGSRSDKDGVPAVRRLPGFGDIPLRIGVTNCSKALDSASLINTAKSTQSFEDKSRIQEAINKNNSIVVMSSPAGNRFLAKAMASASQFIGDSPKAGELGNVEGKTSVNLIESTVVGAEHNETESKPVLPAEQLEQPALRRKRTASVAMQSASGSGTVKEKLDIRKILNEAVIPVGGTIRIPGFMSVSNPKWRELKGLIRDALPTPRSPEPIGSPSRPFKRQRFTPNGSLSTMPSAAEGRANPTVKSEIIKHEILEISDDIWSRAGASSNPPRERLVGVGSTALGVKVRGNSVVPPSAANAWDTMNVVDEVPDHIDTVPCPVCTVPIPAWRINEHLDSCLL